MGWIVVNTMFFVVKSAAGAKKETCHRMSLFGGWIVGFEPTVFSATN